MMQRMRVVTVALAVVAAVAPALPVKAAPAPPPEIRVLSNRPDLVSGGDALVQIVYPATVLPSAVRVLLNGRDVTVAFARRSDGRFVGRLTGLVPGSNTVT